MESKERPILFSGPMVRAILDGKKTQTRRVVKPQPSHGFDASGYIVESSDKSHVGKFRFSDNGDKPWESEYIRCPYGVPGDRLWVRETWADVNSPDGPAICYRADGSYMHWQDFSETFGPDYGIGPSMDYDAYPGDYVMWWEDLLNGEPNHGWKPSIHMYRWASRINLEIIAIGVERVQDISGKNADAEGIKSVVADGDITDFAFLWDKINGKKHPWKDNPWVWVVKFKRV